jgi:hypothetical protein
LENSIRRLFDSEKGMRTFESLLENRMFAFALLFSSLGGLVASLLIFNGTTILSQANPFQSADLYKIALFARGVSPYSTEPWAAPYPPLYFALWAPLYLFLDQILRLSETGVFEGTRIISALALCASAYLIYKSQTTVLRPEESGVEKNKAVSCASLFLLCSLVAIIYPVGDALGLLLLAGACAVFAYGKNASLLGVALVSLAVAFKVHPVLGALLLLGYYYYSTKKIGAIHMSDFQKALVAFGSVMIGLVAIPILLLPGSLGSFLFYNAENIQYYTFNAFAGLYDVLVALSPGSGGTVSFAVDAVWILLSVVLLLVLVRSLFGKGRSAILSQGGVVALDLLSLGMLAWLVVLKQTMPHYFLWALVPLLARGRTRSTYYLLAGEFFGMVFFGLAQAITTNFFTFSGYYPSAPSLEVSLLLLVGGILFDVFAILAMRQLMRDMKSTAKPKVLERPLEAQPQLPLEKSSMM